MSDETIEITGEDLKRMYDEVVAEKAADEEKTPSGYTRGELRSLIRSSGGCGEPSPDGMRICIKEPDHEGLHGWDSVEFPYTFDLRNLIFELLYNHFTENGSDYSHQRGFVGLQGDKIVVLQPGGQHYAVLVLPAHTDAPA